MTCEQADRTMLASHLTSVERFAKAGKATQDEGCIVAPIGGTIELDISS